jgi:hypothetical protein
MRYYLLAGVLPVLAVIMFSCKDLLTNHNIDLDGAEHGEKLYSGEKNCTSCHGINLNGNGPIPGCYSCHEALWDNSLHTEVRGGVGHRAGFFAASQCGDCHGGSSLRGSRSRPSCYECHDDVWSALAIHTVSQDGVYHAPGLNSPLVNCVSCHGSDLLGSGNAPSCYQCHGNKWDEGGDDDD